MINISGLIKIYKSKEHQQTALNNISLCLPSTGMIFITGESGSGKSTLLHLIGGLDSITYGEINVDGNSLAKLSEKELANYRSSYLGFIFQDYSLIKKFNVYKNVKLSLDIVGDNNYSKVDEVLDKVGLSKYKTRYPNQLSGGQCQRVAIARAIVKDPKIILCDEPTGNLDSENSSQVLDILKELSKDKLVIVVSHSKEEARKYADRIIELGDGQVISDFKNDLSKDYKIEDNVLYLSNIDSLSSDDLTKINDNLHSIKEIKPINRLSKVEEIKEEPKQVKFTNNKFKGLLKTGGSFLKHSLITLSLISLFSGALIATQGMTQNLTNFEASEVIEDILVQNNEPTLVMKKAYKNANGKTKTNYLSRIKESDAKAVSKYQNECYELINYSLPISLSNDSLIKQSTLTENSNLKEIYAAESYGVLVTNQDYVKGVFGKLKLLAGSLDSQPNYGIYITDYLADSIMHFQTGYNGYSDLLGAYTYKMSNNETAAYISGVIDTGYKAKYSDVIERYLTAKSEGDLSEISKIQDENIYVELIDRITSIYGIGYSFNSNFLNDCKNTTARTFARLDRVQVNGTVVGKKQSIKIASAAIHQSSESGYSVPSKTILMTQSAINNLLGTNYTYIEMAALLPIKANITGYSAVAYATNDINNYEYKLDINIDVRNDKYAGSNPKNYGYIASDDLFDIFQEATLFPYAYHFSNIHHTKEVYTILRDIPFVPSSPYAEAAATVGNVVESYNAVFVLIAVLLVVIALSLIAGFSFFTIKNHKNDIGILKALGAKDADIIKIFLLQIGVMAIITSIVSIVCEVTLTNAMDIILLKVIEKAMNNSYLSIVQLIKLNPLTIILDVVLIIVFVTVGAIIPFIMMKKIKPIQIIKGSK